MDKWLIKVAGWGEIVFVGTEAEAEDWRVHKSNWEGGIASKRKAAAADQKTHRSIFADAAGEQNADR